MTQDPQHLWEGCMRLFRNNINEQQYQTWFNPMKLKSYDAASHELHVFVPSPFFYEYLEEHFRGVIHKVIYRVFGEGTRLIYEVEVADNATMDITSNDAPSVVRAQPSEHANESPNLLQAATPAQDLDSQLNINLNFKNFIEAESNRLPCTVGKDIATRPNRNVFNPLFVYGPSGVGKTHLLNAIGTRVKELHPTLRVLYLSAHLFEVQYTDSVRKNCFNDFMFFYQSIDVLIVDDIQEIAGKKATEYTFFHIFNHLRQLGKQIIIASDRPPVELKGMQERLITRFGSGLTAELQRPEEELRRHILEQKVKSNGLNFSSEVIEYISRNVSENVRELEGTINSLLAYSVVYKREIDLDFAQFILRNNARVEHKPITLERIIECTCEYYKVREEDIYGHSRKANIAMARHMCIYLASNNTQLTSIRIGSLIGGRHHSTVLHSIETIKEQISLNNKISEDVKNLEKMLKQ
ncbi:MAG: chromosomal replication initiator protein DnaA [Bacteroidaceae bacterium]|nr:chromosomal replication initiator protein DnaA [Bacteroidaceae bacterium]